MNEVLQFVSMLPHDCLTLFIATAAAAAAAATVGLENFQFGN